MSIRDYLFDRRNGFVFRWHARQTVRQESLAEHHYFVARDTLLICQALLHYGIAEPNTFDAVVIAMIHDEVEKETGDVSGAAKRRYPGLKQKLVEIELGVIDNLLFSSLPDAMGDYYRRMARRISDPDEDDLEVQIVKYADKLEAYLFAKTELDIGNQLMNDVTALIGKELEGLTWPWLCTLRKETGLP